MGSVGGFVLAFGWRYRGSDAQLRPDTLGDLAGNLAGKGSIVLGENVANRHAGFTQHRLVDFVDFLDVARWVRRRVLPKAPPRLHVPPDGPAAPWALVRQPALGAGEPDVAGDAVDELTLRSP